MSQTKKVSKLQVRSRAPGEISTGFNTEILLDGTLVKGVTFLKFEVKAGRVAKVLMEMIAEVDVETDVQPEIIKK